MYTPSIKMSKEVPYRAVEYGNGEEAVALVTGFAGSVNDLERAGRDLASGCRKVIVYEYPTSVLLDGDAEQLPRLVETLNADFMARTPDHMVRRFGGVSLGGAVASNMQKEYINPERGLFAATGIDAAELVMNHHMFRAVVKKVHGVDPRRAFEANGYTLNDLKERWQEFQEPPVTPFTLALGGLDYIARQRKVMAKVKMWEASNPDIRIIQKPLLGHNGTIKWFNTNIDTVLGPEEAVTAPV